MKDKLMDTLYGEYAEQGNNTLEYDYMLERLCKFISDDDYTAVIDGVNAESRQAFQAGFQTAVSLLIGGAN